MAIIFLPCPHISSPYAIFVSRSPPNSPKMLSTYLPYAQKFGYADEPSANTANRTFDSGPNVSSVYVSVVEPRNESNRSILRTCWKFTLPKSDREFALMNDFDDTVMLQWTNTTHELHSRFQASFLTWTPLDWVHMQTTMNQLDENYMRMHNEKQTTLLIHLMWTFCIWNRNDCVLLAIRNVPEARTNAQKF